LENATDSQDEELEQRRAREKLAQVLERLDEDKRAVFVLYELEELTMPQVAEALGCPLTTAYSRLHAARKTVRAAFARQSLMNWRAE
jgi:RNA polymerase sigma-70 factor (ECF subfamily)